VSSRSDITLIAAPTPFDGKKIDLQYIEDIAAKVGAAIEMCSTITRWL
jgi:UDP-N-acetyl-D-mannosaminuronate dehydrogenase